MDEIKAYKSVLKTLIDNPNLFGYHRYTIQSIAEGCIYANELASKYGFKINTSEPISSDWHKLRDYTYLGLYDGVARKISWSDDNRQPKNEILLQICFPEGAYIFGSSFENDYPTEFFHRFFDELRAYNPKFTDSANKALYFSLENAGVVFNEFPKILEKYRKENLLDAKKRKAEKLRKEAEKLESEI